MASRRPGDAADTVRSAVDRTFQATLGGAQVTRERAQELVDDVAQAASRVRDVLDDLRVATGEDVRSLRLSIEALERRVSELERKSPEHKSPEHKSPRPRKQS
jgi:polyhydroxyalkanoate synthesis regulator phasin